MAPMSIYFAVENGMLSCSAVKGRSFCITGTLSVKRSQMVDLISALGGANVVGVSHTTDYLIVPTDKGASSSKYEKALLYGTKIITEAEFCEMIMATEEELRSGGCNVRSSRGEA